MDLLGTRSKAGLRSLAPTDEECVSTALSRHTRSYSGEVDCCNQQGLRQRRGRAQAQIPVPEVLRVALSECRLTPELSGGTPAHWNLHFIDFRRSNEMSGIGTADLRQQGCLHKSNAKG